MMPTNWPRRFAELQKLDGAEWDALYDKIVTEWRAEFRAAFLDWAWRRGWRYEDAHSWLDDGDLAEDAYNEYHANFTPQEAGEHAVIECEREIANS